MHVVLISRPDDPEASAYTGALAADLETLGYRVTFERRTGEALGKAGTDFSDIEADIAVVIGGDGSVLLTIQQLKRQIPVIGINWGEVGFLADLEPAEAHRFFEHIRGHGYSIEKRMRIALSLDGVPIGNALNEAVIVTTRPAKMLRFTIMIDGTAAEQFRADGILISTPTGSTAYAMSAGGPIVDPRIEGFLLVPLAPYMLSSRPHLISHERAFEVRLESTKPAHLVLDGQQDSELATGCSIRIEKSPQPALFVDVGKNFFTKVDSKLRRL
ncbi:MAG: NAD(+)/NADH kinase [Methanomicrobiales archaeon]|nr:NAD(+)/NADH kinase [Methanomicrobiales archaeon]